MSKPTAVLLANGLLQTAFAKTTCGLIRGPSRYRVSCVVDPSLSGRDAGEIFDGRNRNIPVVDSLSDAISSLGTKPDVCVVGVATVGGILPPDLRHDLLEAARRGITLINGMHQLIEDDTELVDACRMSGAEIFDIRKPKSIDEMKFWTGSVLDLDSTRIAVLGIDCAVGKRTTAVLVWDACRRAGISTEMIYTGQTGWLQGFEFGFVLDATPNDFVCGELEQALVDCQKQKDPDLILIEGQSGLRNPSGPCGTEILLGGAVSGVILQHVPGRKYFEGLEDRKLRIPPVEEEVALIRSLGFEVLAVTINPEGLDPSTAEQIKKRLQEELSIPVIDPLLDGVGEVAARVLENLESRSL